MCTANYTIHLMNKLYRAELARNCNMENENRLRINHKY